MKYIRLSSLLLLIISFQVRLAAQINEIPDMLFSESANWIVKHQAPLNAGKTFKNNLRLIFKPLRPVRWTGVDYYPDIELLCQSRNFTSLQYGKYLNELFRNFLVKHKWKIIQLASDHYGNTEYRILLKAQKDSISFFYIYTARQSGDDWDGHIYIFPGKTGFRESGFEYRTFFSQVTGWISNPTGTKKIDSNGCFMIKISEHPENYRLTEDFSVKFRLLFYCQFGHSSTPGGFGCYGGMPELFTDFLKEQGYRVIQLKDLSVTGWQRTIYSVRKNHAEFSFLFESESAASSGYAKIRILIEN